MPIETDEDGVNRFTTDQEIETLIEEYQSSFPLPYLLMVFGYAFILLIDKVIIDSASADLSALANAKDKADKDKIENVDDSLLQPRSSSQDGSANRPNYQINDAAEDAII